jgi:hypothetical protein
MRVPAILAGVLAAGLYAMAARADVPPVPVDLALALAVDVSGSIDPDEARSPSPTMNGRAMAITGWWWTGW